MIELTAILIGLLLGGGLYLMLQRNLLSVFFGLSLLTHGANLFVLAMSGTPYGKLAPIVGDVPSQSVDPLPQALILTAIVIGFGVSAYLVVLLYSYFQTENTLDQAKLYPEEGEE